MTQRKDIAKYMMWGMKSDSTRNSSCEFKASCGGSTPTSSKRKGIVRKASKALFGLPSSSTSSSSGAGAAQKALDSSFRASASKKTEYDLFNEALDNAARVMEDDHYKTSCDYDRSGYRFFMESCTMLSRDEFGRHLNGDEEFSSSHSDGDSAGFVIISK